MNALFDRIVTLRTPLAWLVTLTIVFATMYGLVQQQNRLLANDMPTLLATESARLIENGLDPKAVANSSPADITKSQVPFVIVYDKSGKPVSGSGYIDNKLAQVPKGVLESTKSGQPHAVTWEPKSGLRFATVTVAVKDYYVVGAQSLSATEDRADRLLRLSIIGYLLSLLVMFGYYVLRVQTLKKPKASA